MEELEYFDYRKVAEELKVPENILRTIEEEVKSDFPSENMPEAKFIFDKNASLEDLVTIANTFENVEVSSRKLKEIYNAPIENNDEDILKTKWSVLRVSHEE